MLKGVDSTLFFFLSTPAYFLALLFYLISAVFGGSVPVAPRSSLSRTGFLATPMAGGGAAALSVEPRSRGAAAKAETEAAGSGLPWSRLARWMTILGVLLSTVGVGLRTIELGNASHWAITTFLPVTTTYETLTFMAWIIPLAYLVFERRYRVPGVGAIVTGLAFAMLAVAASPTIAPRAVAPIVPALQSYWLVIHVLFMMVGIACFTTGFGASLVLLWRRYRGEPPEALKKIEELAYKANALGFPFYGIGGLVFGGIWAKEAWGRYWEWDPKETAMLIAWLAYAVYLHARISWGWRDLRTAWLSVLAYGMVLYTWIGINYFVASLHSFT